MPGTDAPITEAERTDAIASERLVCVDPAENNNKFWNGYVLGDGTFASEHGRVRDKGTASIATNRKAFNQSKSEKHLEKEARKKMNYKDRTPYVRQSTLGSGGVSASNSSSSRGKSISSAAIKSTAIQEIDFGGNATLRQLITDLSNFNVHTIVANSNISYDAATGSFSTALGPVGQESIDDARALLSQIANHVANNDLEDRGTLRLIGDYLQIIPQDTGVKRGWHQWMFGQSDSMRKQNDLLDSLAASIQQVQATPKKKTKTSTKKVFDVQIEVVDDGKTVDQVRRKYRNTKGSHYDVADLDVKTVFKVKINTVHSAFKARGEKVGNVKQLWHGTKCSSLLAILKSGLIIPPTSSSHVTGRYFGDGIYFSDQPTKSIRYATNAWASGGRTDRTFMFLAQVSLGRSYTPTGYGGLSRLPTGYDSCFAKAGISGVQNNEMVIYHPSQCDLVYLIEFSPYGK